MKNIPLQPLRELFTVSVDGTRCEFTQQLDRDIYKRIADALNRIEGRWSKKDNAFVFPFDASEEIEEIFTTGNLPKRNPLQLHPTPRSQVLDMLESSDNAQCLLRNAATILADTGKPVRMLEPSIGLCGIADVVNELYPAVEIIGVELDGVNAKLAANKGYQVTNADFLQYPIPATEDERFDLVVMNPPFMGRDFIKHIRHAQAMLKKNGVLISVMPFAWMASASSKTECEFLDEVSRTSSMLREPYPAGTYENTDCVTCIVEMMHPEKYARYIEESKDYWMQLNAIEIENDSKFRVNFDRMKPNSKLDLLRRELTKKRNAEGIPSVIEWLDEMLVLLVDENDPYFNEVVGVALSSAIHEKTAKVAVESVAVESVAVESVVAEHACQDIENKFEIEVVGTANDEKDPIVEQAQQEVLLVGKLPRMLKPFIIKNQRQHNAMH